MRRKIKKRKRNVAQKRARAKKKNQKAKKSVKIFFEEPVEEKMVLPAKSPEWRRATLGD